MAHFELWLEFEHIEWSDEDVRSGFANILVTLAGGRKYAINVWTFQFFRTSIAQDVIDGRNLGGLYSVPPDLFVKELTRECIYSTIENILKTDNLENTLNPSIIVSPE
jgi:hypothetical protein